MKVLQDFAKEINNDWSEEYRALVQDGELRVLENHSLVCLVYENLDIEPEEECTQEIIDQLSYMIER